MRIDNIDMLQDTLSILEQGYYVIDGKKTKLKLSRKQMETVQVFLPQDIDVISQKKDFPHTHVLGRTSIGCRNTDSFSQARKCYETSASRFVKNRNQKILVLNLANPVHPGGGVRKGAVAQEEDLCRKSSLLLSLESTAAQTYYRYNKSLHTYMGSDAVIITPDVEIIRDERGNLLEDSVLVSVMTCAAPMLRNGLEGMTDQEYREMVYKRITGMLKVAAYMGYQALVLGAFGCGAFRNDARIVSDLFYRAMKEFDFDGMKLEDFFRCIDFAVLCRPHALYNYKEFARNFADFYEAENQKMWEEAVKEVEKTKKAAEIYLDQIRGSMIGGAIGDALGYTVEFWQEDYIFRKYGENGITSYELANGKALISDDTQMTLFTANGLLVRETRGKLRGESA